MILSKWKMRFHKIYNKFRVLKIYFVIFNACDFDFFSKWGNLKNEKSATYALHKLITNMEFKTIEIFCWIGEKILEQTPILFCKA